MVKRVQMRRGRPWRPENPTAVRVDRTTKWGNPYRIGDVGVPDAATAVRKFRDNIALRPENRKLIMDELKGKDLACWCRPDQPCHADVLMEVANEPGTPKPSP